jgi:NAD(P)-dependent dehydrogenase (short-subunit alcohol dehydrogenase family)
MDKFRFDGQVAVVTGAGAGLGKAYATLLAERGARVLVNDYNPSTSGVGGGDPAPAEATTAEIAAAGGTAAADAESVATPEGASAIIDHALGLWGRVDILINNAGFVAGRSIATVTDEQWRSDMAVAADGTFFMCRAVWNHMWERNYGRIINTCSGSFFGMGTGVVAYPAAKAAAWAITKGLAAYSTAADRDVLINCIMPTAYGRMTPGMGPEIAAMMEREFPPSKVAPLVALLAHADAPATARCSTPAAGSSPGCSRARRTATARALAPGSRRRM